MTLEEKIIAVIKEIIEAHSPVQPESEFYLLEADDTYRAKTGVQLEFHPNDQDYPMSLTVRYESGQELGVVLTKDLIRQIGVTAQNLGII